MRVFSTNDKVLLQKKILPALSPKKKHQLLPQNYSPRKPTAIYNMTNEIKEKEKKKNKKQKEASSTTFK